MNQDFEDIRRAVQHFMTDLKEKNVEAVSHAIAQYIVTLDETKRFKAGQKEPRIRIRPEERTDGWRERMQGRLDAEDMGRGGL